MSILRYLRTLWDDAHWTHGQFAVALILGLIFFGHSSPARLASQSQGRHGDGQ